MLKSSHYSLFEIFMVKYLPQGSDHTGRLGQFMIYMDEKLWKSGTPKKVITIGNKIEKLLPFGKARTHCKICLYMTPFSLNDLANSVKQKSLQDCF